MGKSEDTYIQIDGDGQVKFAFYGHYLKESNGTYSWYLPAFDLFFSSPNKEEGDKRAVVMVKGFLRFWIQQQGTKQFGLQLHKLGFRATNNHHTTLQNFLNNRVVRSKFKAPTVDLPQEFAKSKPYIHEGEMAVA